MPLLSCHQLAKSYKDENQTVDVLDDVSFSIDPGERVAILGSSGSGKSTLLHLLGALDHPSSGRVVFEDADVFSLSEKDVAAFRNQSLGFIYQLHHLLPEFTAVENVCMPLLIRKVDAKNAEQRAKALLDKVGLSHRYDHKPAQLSGGERQRVAIARALVGEPKLVLADEPTGNLDHQTGEGIYQLIQQLSQDLGISFIVVTHDVALAKRMDRILYLTDGKLTSNEESVQ